jgi:hypothetical protein
MLIPAKILSSIDAKHTEKKFNQKLQKVQLLRNQSSAASSDSDYTRCH